MEAHLTAQNAALPPKISDSCFFGCKILLEEAGRSFKYWVTQSPISNTCELIMSLSKQDAFQTVPVARSV